MRTSEFTKPLLRMAEIARRWQMPPETVAGFVTRGELRPVSGGRSPLFALADVVRIEVGRMVGQPECDITLSPLSSVARTSPVALLCRLQVASDCMGAAEVRGITWTEAEVSPLLSAIRAVRGVLDGSCSGVTSLTPPIGPQESFGVRLGEPGDCGGLLKIAQSAVLHLLGAAEPLQCLRELGTAPRGRFINALQALETEVNGRVSVSCSK